MLACVPQLQVLRVRFYVKRNWKGAKLTLSRRNIMLRDRFCCQ